jgi:2Fe-2S ferredoxin
MTVSGMSTIVLIKADGERITVPIKPGSSVMEAAVARNSPGIEAQCYGAGVCGTCHVYACPPMSDLLPPRSTWEEQMLANLPLAQADSRLSCQIRFEERFDGAEFRIPERQDAVG